MYNPASILHTIARLYSSVPSAVPSNLQSAKTVFLTLGTNHVYRLKETGEIVDNCQKRPQSLFTEEELSVEECAGYLQQAIDILRQMNPEIHIVLTVSPIRYRKYGYHGSQLSKATLLLAVEKVLGNHRKILGDPRNPRSPRNPRISYFPAYEIINDELRDYRFYQEDMLHPSQQAVDYIWERLVEIYFSDEAKTFLEEWRPIKQALNHKPFDPESDEYRRFQEQTKSRLKELQEKYPVLKEI
jgi:lysophospholipase L1-like esterase